MQKSTIILGSSLAVVSSLLIYTITNKETQEKIVVVEKECLQAPVSNPDISTKAPVVSSVQKAVEINRDTQNIELAQKNSSVQAIEPQEAYSLSVIPENMSIQEKKKRFNTLLIPAIENVYDRLLEQHNEAKTLIESNPNDPKIQKLMEEYFAIDTKELLQRLKPHPKSLAIAQAAIQSGWATSRFTQIAKNLFGVWSFDPNEPRVQAQEMRDGEAVYLKKYDSLNASIEDYYKLLAISPSYEEFRDKKMQTNNPYELIPLLSPYYNEEDLNYEKNLNVTIEYNELEKYD